VGLVNHAAVSATAYNWQFVFLGANMDAIVAGQTIGV